MRQNRSGASDAIDVLRVVVEDLVVDLVRHDDQLVLAGQLRDPRQHLGRVDRSGRVVGVDDDDGLGAVGDLAGEVVEVGCPAGLLVAEVVDGVPPASEAAAVHSG